LNRAGEILMSLDSWIRKENYEGYDPYDILNSKFSSVSPKFRFYIQQFGKFFPLNIRPMVGVNKKAEPKAIALIALAYLNMRHMDERYLKDGMSLLERLIPLKGDEEFAWGYTFPWQSRDFYLKSYEPNIVVTSICGMAFLKYYETTKDEKYLKIAQSSARYISTKLNRHENDGELCFSYTVHDNSRVTDGNLFAGALMSAIYYHTGKDIYMEMVKKIIRYTEKTINPDGSIVYAYDGNGNEITQYDYHQGFDIMLLMEIERYTGMELKRYIDMATEYYLSMFKNGVSRYRNEKKWPIDIHNQAQGILTFSYLSKFNRDYLKYAEEILRWTVGNMWDEKGYFYYHIWPFMKNKIAYMRWSEAWMLLALSAFLKAGGEI
jgi:uncharacterized protein YyaL (SSP411 family)